MSGVIRVTVLVSCVSWRVISCSLESIYGTPAISLKAPIASNDANVSCGEARFFFVSHLHTSGRPRPWSLLSDYTPSPIAQVLNNIFLSRPLPRCGPEPLLSCGRLQDLSRLSPCQGPLPGPERLPLSLTPLNPLLPKRERRS